MSVLFSRRWISKEVKKRQTEKPYVYDQPYLKVMPPMSQKKKVSSEQTSSEPARPSAVSKSRIKEHVNWLHAQFESSKEL